MVVVGGGYGWMDGWMDGDGNMDIKPAPDLQLSKCIYDDINVIWA